MIQGADWDRPSQIREQQAWDEHAAFMDGLIDDGLVVLGVLLGRHCSSSRARATTRSGIVSARTLGVWRTSVLSSSGLCAQTPADVDQASGERVRRCRRR